MSQKKYGKVITYFYIFLLSIVLLCPMNVHAATSDVTQKHTIRVAFPAQDGMSFLSSDGTPNGYSYTYLQKIAEYTGWKMEYVPYDSGDENTDIQNAMDDIKAGKVDLLGPILKDTETESEFLFPENSYGTVYTTLCALETSNIREDNAVVQIPLRVGLLRQADTRNAETISYLDREHFTYEVTYYESEEERYDDLKNGKIDVVTSVSLFPIPGTRIVEKYASRPYYFVSSPENTELIRELDQAISILDQVQPSLQDTLFERYFRDARYVFSPTEEQKEYLKTPKKLEVLCINNDAPYVYQRENGEAAGMLISVLNDFAQRTDLDIHYTFCDYREDAEVLMKKNHYDLFIGMPFTSDYCAEIGFVRSKSIMESNLAYVHDGENNSRKCVAVEQGLEDIVDTSDFDEVVLCNNVMSCIAAVKTGVADYAIGDRSGLEYYIYDSYSSLVTSLIAGTSQTVCVAIARDSDLEFIRLLNDYIYSLSDLQKTAFLEDGTAHVHHTTLLSYVLLHPIQAVVLCVLLTAVVVIAISMMFHAKKMRRKNVELEVANHAKSEFLTRMSHDIRTPMNGIVGMLEIADRNIDDPDMVKYYHGKIRTASEYLLALINDVLDMSKLDYEEIKLTDDSVYLRALLENCIDILEVKATEQGLQLLTPDLNEFKPPRVFTSEVHLRQVIMNLVSNAIKYNRPKGRIVLSAKVTEQTEETVTCCFGVKDTGIGMSERFQKKMFEPFSQEHGEDRSELKGTGLGLSIVKRIVDQMGGNIEVDSIEGVGTTFTCFLTFTIDKDYKERKQQNVLQTVDLAGKHILAAEDNKLNAEILSYMIEDMGAVIDLAVNGQQAVDMFAASQPGTYDLILMDILMPVMDGYTASRTIRMLSHPDARTIPIIALTANAFTEDIAKSTEAGMDAHITKPIDVEKLRICMMQLLAKKK